MIINEYKKYLTKPKAVKQQRTKSCTCKSSSTSDIQIKQTCFDSDIRLTLKPYNSTINGNGSSTENTISNNTSDQSDIDSNHDTENLTIRNISGIESYDLLIVIHPLVMTTKYCFCNRL